MGGQRVKSVMSDAEYITQAEAAVPPGVAPAWACTCALRLSATEVGQTTPYLQTWA